MIRPARAGDEAALAAIEVRAALHADELLAPEDAEPDPDAWSSAVVVAEVGGRVVGGARPDRVVVDPPAQGAGLGSALWGAVTAGEAPREAWVCQRDGLARSFAERAGFAPTGEVREGPLGPEVRHCAS